MLFRQKIVKAVKDSIVSFQKRFLSSKISKKGPVEGQPGYSYLARSHKLQKGGVQPGGRLFLRTKEERAEEAEENKLYEKNKKKRPLGYGEKNFIERPEIRFFGELPKDEDYFPSYKDPRNEFGNPKSTLVFPQGDKGNTARVKTSGIKPRNLSKRLKEETNLQKGKKPQNISYQYNKKTDFSFEAYLNYEANKQRPRKSTENRWKPGITVDELLDMFPGQGMREHKYRDGTTEMKSRSFRDGDTPYVTKDFTQEKTTRVKDKNGVIVTLFMDLDGSTVRVDSSREQEYQDHIFRIKNNSKFLKQHFTDGAYPQFEVPGYANYDFVARDKQFDVMNEMVVTGHFGFDQPYMNGYGYEETYDTQKVQRRVPQGAWRSKNIFGEKAAFGLGVFEDIKHTQQGVVTEDVAREVGDQQHGGTILEEELRVYLNNRQTLYFSYRGTHNSFSGPERKKGEGIPNYNSFQGRASAWYTMVPQNQKIIVKDLLQTYMTNQIKPVRQAKEITDEFKKQLKETVVLQQELLVVDRGSNNFGVSRTLLPQNEGNSDSREYEIVISSKFDYPIVGGVIHEGTVTRRVKVPSYIKLELVCIEFGGESIKTGQVTFSGAAKYGINTGELLSKIRKNYLIPRVSTEHGHVGNGSQKLEQFSFERQDGVDVRGMKDLHVKDETTMEVEKSWKQRQEYANDFAGRKKFSDDIISLQSDEGQKYLSQLDCPITKENVKEVRRDNPYVRRNREYNKIDTSEVQDYQETEQVGGLGIPTLGEARQDEYVSDEMFSPRAMMYTNDRGIPIKLYKSKKFQSFNDKLGFKKDRSIESVGQRKEKGFYNTGYHMSMPSAEPNSLINSQYVFSSYAFGEEGVESNVDVLSPFVDDYVDYTNEDFKKGIKSMMDRFGPTINKLKGSKKFFYNKFGQKPLELARQEVSSKHAKNKVKEEGQVEGPVPGVTRESRKRREQPELSFDEFVKMVTYEEMLRETHGNAEREKVVNDSISGEERLKTLVEQYSDYTRDRFYRNQKREKLMLSQYGRNYDKFLSYADDVPGEEEFVTQTRRPTWEEVFRMQRHERHEQHIAETRKDYESGFIKMEGPYLQKAIKMSQDGEEEYMRIFEVGNKERKDLMQKLHQQQEIQSNVKRSIQIIIDDAKLELSGKAEAGMFVGYGADVDYVKPEVVVQSGVGSGFSQFADVPESGEEDEGMGHEQIIDNQDFDEDLDDYEERIGEALFQAAPTEMWNELEPHVKYVKKNYREKYDIDSHEDMINYRFPISVQNFQTLQPKADFSVLKNNLQHWNDRAPSQPMLGYKGDRNRLGDLSKQVKDVIAMFPYLNGYGIYLSSFQIKGLERKDANEKIKEYMPDRFDGQKFLPVEKIILNSKSERDIGIWDEHQYYKSEGDIKTDQSISELKIFVLPLPKEPVKPYEELPSLDKRQEMRKELMDGDTSIQPFIPANYFKDFGMYEEQDQKGVVNKERQEKLKKEQDAERFKQSKRIQKGLDKDDTSQDETLFGSASKKQQGRSQSYKKQDSKPSQTYTDKKAAIKTGSEWKKSQIAGKKVTTPGETGES